MERQTSWTNKNMVLFFTDTYLRHNEDIIKNRIYRVYNNMTNMSKYQHSETYVMLLLCLISVCQVKKPS